MNKTLIVVVGPTAVGKTTAAIRLAKHFSTEIISADSRQFYKEMTIGTAKPDKQELEEVPHHFIGSHSITEPFNTGQFEREALLLLNSLFEKHERVVLTGGSGLYINALCNGMDDLPDVDPEIRQDLNSMVQNEGITPLQELLKEKDPEYHAQVDLQNPQRIIRALEVCLSAGKPFSSFRKGSFRKRDFRIIKPGLNLQREELYDRINRRTDEMFRRGLVEEVRSLVPFRNLNALQTVGYKEVFEYLDGNISLEKAVENVKMNSRRYAKRQLTWFRKDPEIKWFHPEDHIGMVDFIEFE